MNYKQLRSQIALDADKVSREDKINYTLFMSELTNRLRALPNYWNLSETEREKLFDEWASAGKGGVE